MATVTVWAVQHFRGGRTIQIRINFDGFEFLADINDTDRIPDAQLQAMIDGESFAGRIAPSGLKYKAKTDRLKFTAVSFRGTSKMTIARELIASKLATAVGLRQPPIQDVKPAKT